eukprot:6560852-Karenia_brevis.AAC.1
MPNAIQGRDLDQRVLKQAASSASEDMKTIFPLPDPLPTHRRSNSVGASPLRACGSSADFSVNFHPTNSRRVTGKSQIAKSDPYRLYSPPPAHPPPTPPNADALLNPLEASKNCGAGDGEAPT